MMRVRLPMRLLQAELFVVVSLQRKGGLLINAEVETREEALEYQQHAEYELGEVAWIERSE